ncbi:MAG: VCBS repeat-containing protein, partial [Calditrichaeota bacterium]|nr:VCBS repeat-containing protein [Calditrichota bacterium]
MKLFYYRTLIVGLLLSWASLQAQTFTDMSQLLQPGYPLGTKTGQRGASAADYNNDGLVDLYHSNFDSPGRLYLNQGADGFRDVLAEIDLDEGTNMWGAAFGDYDNDGYFDIIFEDLSAPSKLYRNNRNGTFTEVNAAANVAVNTLAQGAAWDDYNLDGKLDLFIVNDVGPNQLFKNLDFQTFTDISISANVQTVGNSYGVSWGDINGDGYPDAYIATCHPNDPLRSINHLLLNNGDETFTNIGQA